jgi:flotillin
VVEAAARGLADSNLTVLNGTEGVGQVLTGIVAQGMAVLDTLRTAPAIIRPETAANGQPPTTELC